MKRNRIIKKIKSQSGESIIETMTAVLIAAMAMTMLAGAIMSGMRIIGESRAKMDTYFQAANAISSGSSSSASEEGTLSNVKIDMTRKITDPSVDVINLKGLTSDDSGKISGHVKYYKDKDRNIVTYHIN